MRRSYGVNPNEWDLMFYAPLTSDFEERVNGLQYKINPLVGYEFGDSRGVLITNTSNRNQAAVSYTNTVAYNQKLLNYTEFLSTVTVNVITAYNTIFGSSYLVKNNRQWYIAQLRGDTVSGRYYPLPLNTDVQLYQHLTISGNYSPYTIYNSVNDSSYFENRASENIPTDRSDTYICWNRGSNGGVKTYIKDFKIYGKKL